MRKIGAHVSSAGGPQFAIKNILQIGGNCLQIFAGSPRTWARRLYTPSEFDQFNLLATKHELYPVFIHGLYLVNLGSDNPDTLMKSYDALLCDLQNGDLINSAGVIVHLGSHQGRGFATVKKLVVDQIRSLLNNSRTTPFLIENSSYQQGKIGTIEELHEIFDALSHPRLKICLDTAHLFEAGFNLIDTQAVADLVDQLDRFNLLNSIACIHLNDSKTKLNSRHDQHANLGEGEVGLPGLRNFVTHPAFSDIPLILEVPGENKTGPDTKNILAAQSLIN